MPATRPVPPGSACGSPTRCCGSSPNLADPGRAGTEPLLLRTRVFLDHPRLEATQGGRVLGSFRPRRLIPNRSHTLPADWLRLVRPGEDVLLSVS